MKLMALLLGDKISPDIEVSRGPTIRPTKKDIMRKNIIVSKGRNYRNLEIIGRVGVVEVVVLAKDIDEARDEEAVLRKHLILATGDVFVVVMTRTVARPYDEIDAVGDIVFDPLERGIDQRNWAVAVAEFGTVRSGRSGATMTSSLLLGRCIVFVERIWVEICRCSGAVSCSEGHAPGASLLRS